MSMPQKIRCKVVGVNDHGGHVYTLELKPERPAPQFLPGQFMHLAVATYEPGDFWPESRVFSIASTPTRREQLSITYSVVGNFTTKMEQRIKVGTEVWAKLPYGDFIIQSKSDIVLIAGGTGITAFAAFLTDLPKDYPWHVQLFYGARKPGLLIYRSLVENAMQRCSAFQAHLFVEIDADGKECLPGRIDLESVWASVPNPLAVTYYLAGPPEMMEALTSGLERHGVDSSRIISDAWE